MLLIYASFPFLSRKFSSSLQHDGAVTSCFWTGLSIGKLCDVFFPSLVHADIAVPRFQKIVDSVDFLMAEWDGALFGSCQTLFPIRMRE